MGPARSFKLSEYLEEMTVGPKGSPWGGESLECNATDTSRLPKTLSKKYLRDTFLYTPRQQESRRLEPPGEQLEKSFENFLRLPKKSGLSFLLVFCSNIDRQESNNWVK